MGSSSPARPELTRMEISSAVHPDAFDLYRDAAAGLFESHLGTQDFFCRTESYDLGVAVLSRFESAEQTFFRTRKQARLSDVDHVHLNIDLTGTWTGDYDGESIKGGRGTLRISNLARPFANYSTDFATLNLVVSRSALGPAWADRDIHGLVMTDRNPGVRLLLAHMHHFWDSIGALSMDEAVAASTAAGALIEGVLSGRLDRNPVYRKPIERTLFAIACAYIERHLIDERLTPDAVGAHLGVSRRTVYRLFRDSGGVGAYVQGRRLDRAFDVVANSTDKAASLAEIAYDHGFLSAAHFSRAFRTRFGATPGEVRGLSKIYPPRPPAPETGSERIIDWLRRMP